MDSHRNLILASRSPRRLQLLKQIGMSPTVMPCDIPEAFDPSRTPEDNAAALALKKALYVAGQVPDGVIIGADTIVVLGGEMMGKPDGRRDAVRMLRALSGRTHSVVTGIALVERPSGRHMTGTERTDVTFRNLPLREIEEYVSGGSPLDKAGAYGIQDDYGAVFVTRIEGCFYNVVGLPLSRLHTALQEFQADGSINEVGG
jgi:septum formation protein